MSANDLTLKQERPVYIYGLKDPRTDLVRYVGKTTNLSRRFGAHCYGKDSANAHKDNWIARLRKEGLKPELVTLEVCTQATWAARERYWIAEGLRREWPLLNIEKGGICRQAEPSSAAVIDALRPYLTHSVLSWFVRLPVEDQRALAIKAAQSIFSLVMGYYRGYVTSREMDHWQLWLLRWFLRGEMLNA